MAEKRTDMNLLIGGEAGQGLLTVAQILAKSLVRAGYHIVVNQDYQSRIRGGHNTFALRVSPEEICAPAEEIDLLVALNPETVALHQAELSAEAVIIIDDRWKITPAGAVRVPYATLAPGEHVNIAVLGVVVAVLGLEREIVRGSMEDFFGKKKPEMTVLNEEALDAALSWAAGRNLPEGARLAPVATPPPRLMLNGNEALALGAMSAGVKFCAFYPMTPSTSIPLNLIAAADDLQIVVEQAEDEIAAINMALGASYAGLPAMVTTSGGGFALMVEGVSLAGMTETPICIVVAQRPGPATGLPTRTEQGDLEFVLHAGHGEFPRAIFAPGSVEECFHLSRRALELAEKFQSPVFLLTDQFLADSYRAVTPFALDRLPAVTPGSRPEGVETPYHRFALTDSGISPRLLPGASSHLVVVDSDEHTPDGHITEDLGVRRQMVDKRLKKGEGLREAVLPPVYEGDEKPELLLVTWGSSQGSAREAAARLRAAGTKAALLSFSQVWPLVPEQFLPYLEGAGEVVAVEGNALGQFARLLRRESGFAIGRRVLRYDGLPVTPQEILRQLQGSAK